MNNTDGWTPAKIKALRKKLDVTQADFAHMLGVTFVSVNRWERNHTKPSKLAQKALDALAERAPR